MFPSLTRDEVFRIETRRLWLRWPRLDDAAAMAKWVGLRQVAETSVSLRVGATAAELATRIQSDRQANLEGRALDFAIVRQGDDVEVIGRIDVTMQPGRALELGYQLDPAYWGRGLMSEAVSALCAQVFELAPVNQIEAGVRPSNVGSMRVLEKCGFEATGMREQVSALYGRYAVANYVLARARPSALRAAAQRRVRVPATSHELLGLV